jgi:DNA-binding MarR family transcriptional regulator
MEKKHKPAPAISPKLIDLADFRFCMRRFLSFSEATSEELGISAQQYQLIQVVAAVPSGKTVSISYVAERMLLRHNSAVELVDRAEKAGLVLRLADEADHRRSLVELTAHAWVVLSQLVALHLAELQAEGPALIRALQKTIGDGVAPKRRIGER